MCRKLPEKTPRLRSRSFNFVHDLFYLTQGCAQHQPAFRDLKLAAETLRRYGAGVLYPMEDFVDPDEEEAWEAVRLAGEVATFVKSQLWPVALRYGSSPNRGAREECHHLRARLDALYFHLYGLSKEEAAYILDTFPIVRRHDESSFGHCRTKEMTLACFSVFAGGDTEVAV